MKKMLPRIILYLLILCAAGGCRLNEKPKIALMVRTLDLEIFQRQRDYFINKVKELGGEPIVISAENNDQTQILQADDLLSQGVKALVVFPVNMYTSAAIVRAAHKKGVKVVSYDRLIMNSDLDFYVAHNNLMLGELSANLMVSKKPQGEYMLMCGDKMDRNALLIYDGYMKVLNPYIQQNKIKITYQTFIENWDKTEAFQEFKTYCSLSGSIPDAVLCSSDAFASSIISFLESEKYESKTLISGSNAFLQSCKYIVQGKQEFTVYKSFKDLISDAVIVSFKLMNNEIPESEMNTFNGRKDVPTILLPVYTVDKTNLESTVIKDGYFTKEQIYN